MFIDCIKSNQNMKIKQKGAVNLDLIELTINRLNTICCECDCYKTPNCIKSNCNIGFATDILNKMKDEGLFTVEGGLKLIPNLDTKFYDNEVVAQSIASICKLCKGCNNNHSELCSISLARKSIESVVLKDTIMYPGNPLSYFMEVTRQNENFANMIIDEYRKLG